MKLTPLDIQQQQFRSALWGFDQKEVDAFLDLVANSFEDLIRDNNNLRDELRRKEALLEEHRERERTLKETMITATRVSDEIKEGARKEAEIIIGAAEVQAEQIIQNAHTRLVRIMDELNELKRQRAQFEGGLRSMITTHQKLLDAMVEKEPSTSSPEIDAAARVKRLGADRRAAEKRPKLAPVESENPATETDLPATKGGER